MARFERLAVLGLGLLGGSVALAARRAGVAERISGANRRPEVLESALARRVVDEGGSFEEAAAGADLVVLCTAVRAMPEVAERIAPRLRPGAIVTDVGSVKGPLAEILPGLLPPGVPYVGSHPMAGSHETGLDHARPDLFDGAPCVVTQGGDPAAEARVCEFWERLGGRVLRRPPATHDAEVAWTSHVPHVLAFAFGDALAGAPRGARDVAGPGFRDFTRIGHSSPALWRDILTANRKALAAPLSEVAGALGALARALEAGDGDEVERRIQAARESLRNAPPSADG